MSSPRFDDPERAHMMKVNKAATADAIEAKRTFVRIHPRPRGGPQYFSLYIEGVFQDYYIRPTPKPT